MPTFARIFNGEVLEVYTPPDGFTLEDTFTPEVAEQFQPVPDNVTVRSTINDGVWVIYTPPEPVPPADPTTFTMTFNIAEAGIITATLSQLGITGQVTEIRLSELANQIPTINEV